MKVKPFLKPGFFAVEVAADQRRTEFDLKNQVIVQRETPVDTVFFGDSITHFWELAAYFTGENGIVVNRGIGGDRSEYAARRFAADVLQLKPRHCVMLIGVNDSWDLEFNDWRQEQGLPLSTVVENAKKHLSSLVQQASGLDLYVCSVLPTDMKHTNQEELRHDYILQINDFLRQLCQEKQVTFVDYYSRMVDSDGRRVRPELTLEGLHPTVFGYDLMAETLKEAAAAKGVRL